jgi:hypothetical protein
MIFPTRFLYYNLTVEEVYYDILKTQTRAQVPKHTYTCANIQRK